MLLEAFWPLMRCLSTNTMDLIAYVPIILINTNLTRSIPLDLDVVSTIPLLAITLDVAPEQPIDDSSSSVRLVDDQPSRR